MKVFIAGGTGLLGYHGALELLRRGHDVRTAALPDIALGQWWPSQIQVEHADLFALDARALSRLMEGCDALVYALGPDDRETPPAPAYAYFHERLVLGSGRVIAAAREAGVRRCTVLGSYYATFQRGGRARAGRPPPPTCAAASSRPSGRWPRGTAAWRSTCWSCPTSSAPCRSACRCGRSCCSTRCGACR
ncbi:MAG: NAD(P)-dependent oxidoreductase [Ideonella sp.]|nr:NAD(P)-dependent oxidoreductase [Ideonella sp.]